MAASSKVDAYGFERPDDFDYQTYEEFMSSYLSVLVRRAKKWQTLLNNKESVSKSGKVKRYVRKGIPNEHRGKIWMCISGAEERMNQNKGVFQQYLDGPKDAQVIETIKTDLHRTFPENIYFQDTCDPSGKRKELYNVLVAFAHKNSSIGYCQGLNFIAGLILLIVKNEEASFWLLDTLVTQILPDYYSPDMIGIRVEQEVLGELVKLKVPDVADHMEKHGVSWTLVATKWFICLFIDVLPIETSLRILDSLFYEGSKVLFRVGVTLIKKNKDKIIASDNFPAIVTVFKNIINDSIATNCHEFMQDVFKIPGSFPQTTIERLRVTGKVRVQNGEC